MKTCTYCGCQNQDDATQCRECGTAGFRIPAPPAPSGRPAMRLPLAFVGLSVAAPGGWSLWSLRHQPGRAVLGLIVCGYCFWQVLVIPGYVMAVKRQREQQQPKIGRTNRRAVSPLKASRSTVPVGGFC